MARIAYLGPEGTFSEAALLQMTAAGLIPAASATDATEPLGTDSTPAALDAVRDGSADYACVPIENSIDGTVLATLDNLATGTPLQVLAELTLDVDRVEHAGLDEGEPRRGGQGLDVRPAPARQIVQAHNRVAAREEQFAQMGSKKSGSPGDENSHRSPLLCGWCRPCVSPAPCH